MKIARYDKLKKKVVWHDPDAVPVEKRLLKKPRDWESVGLACHPKQVADFNKRMRDAGISSSAYHRPDGRLVVEGRDKGVRNDVMRFRGVFDRDASYGDHC